MDLAPRRHPAALALGVAGIVLVALYLVAVLVVSGDVPTGTTVLGVDIGGMSRDQAEQTLATELDDEATTPIPVTAGGASAEIDPTKAGLSIDYPATVAVAGGLVLNPVTLIAHLSGSVAVEPVVAVDADALTAAVTSVADGVDRDPAEPTITFVDGPRASLQAGAPGLQVQIEPSADAVRAAYPGPLAEPVALPTDTQPTAITDDEARHVLTTLAEPAVALPATFKVGDASVNVSEDDIAATLTFAPDGATLKASVNGKALHERLADQLSTVETSAVDASFVVRNGTPEVVASKTGLSVSDDDLAAALLPILPATAAEQRTATVSVTTEQPSLTTDQAKDLKIVEKLSSFRQAFPPAEYRYKNVGQAAEYLNGTVILPGATFSMNDTVHERTAANGYTEGTIISGGRFREELGGGVSIITTATWTAGFYAGLERVESHAHGLYISRYTAGLEATVAWGLLDLRMRNDTDTGVLITATRYNDGVLIETWGTRHYDEVTSTFSERTNFTDFETINDSGEACVPSTGSKGFSITVTRKWIKGGSAVRSETIPTTYKPTPNVNCAP